MRHPISGDGLRRSLRVGAAIAAAAIAFAIASPGEAGVVVQGTRVIYPADRKEVTVDLRNPGEAPSLVQVWIDDGNEAGAAAPGVVPFALTPAIFRLDPRGGQSVRVLYTGKPLAMDRETVFWLNVLDIPPKAAPNPGAPNHLDFAFRHRLKLFFRPAHLAGNSADSPGRIGWTLRRTGSGSALIANNPTPYNVSLGRLDIVGAGAAATASLAPAMLGPLTTTTFAIAGAIVPATVRFDYIDDYGAVRSAEAAVRPEQGGD